MGNPPYAQLDPTTLILNSRWYNYTGANSNTGYTSDAHKRLVDGTAVEPDAAKRRALFGQLNDLLLDEQFIIVVASLKGGSAAQRRVQGLAFSYGSGTFRYDEARLEP